MPDEITAEQWRAWREDPCTKRLVVEMVDREMWYLEWATKYRADAIEAMDRGEATDALQRRTREYRGEAGAIRMFIDLIEKSGKEKPAPADGRVSVHG
jgi:hypothetical protein